MEKNFDIITKMDSINFEFIGFDGDKIMFRDCCSPMRVKSFDNWDEVEMFFWDYEDGRI